MGLGMLLNGKISYDYLLIGLVVSPFIAGLLVGLSNSSATQQDSATSDRDVAPAAFSEEESAPAPNPVIKKPAEKTSPQVQRQDAGKSHGKADGQVDLKRAIHHLDALPAMPIIAQKLLTLRLDSDKGQRELLVLIEQDPQISAKIIGLANSAIFGVTRQIKVVRDAAILLGYKRVQSVATSIAMLSLMGKASSGQLKMHDLWLHNFGVALAMERVARFMPEPMRPQEDQIFLVGMLHDIGYLALAFLDTKQSDLLHARLAEESERCALEIEREILEVCHDELGAELARHWNLPDEIIAVLRYHHNPNAAGAPSGQPLARMVNIVERLRPSFGIREQVAVGISGAEWEVLGIDPSRADEVKQQVDEQMEHAIQMARTFA